MNRYLNCADVYSKLISKQQNVVARQDTLTFIAKSRDKSHELIKASFLIDLKTGSPRYPMICFGKQKVTRFS